MTDRHGTDQGRKNFSEADLERLEASGSDTSRSDTRGDTTIELREERLIVEKEREVAGRVSFTRELRRETVQVPVELVTEVLVIEHLADGPAGNEAVILLDDTPLAPGERRELLVYREEAHIEKRVVVREQVQISKRQVVETRRFEATLGREELVVHPQGDVSVTESAPGDIPR